MTRPHIPPGFDNISVEYIWPERGYIAVQISNNSNRDRYLIEVTTYSFNDGDAEERGPTFTAARAKVYAALRGYPDTLAEVKRVLGPKKKGKER